MTQEEIRQIHQRVLDQVSMLPEDIAIGNSYTASERLFVIRMLVEAQRTSKDVLTPKRAELVDRLSWALFDAVYGGAERVADDLDGIEEVLP